MPIETDYLTKLICAANAAKHHEYRHTSRALDRMIVQEKFRIQRDAAKSSASDVALKDTNASKTESV